MKEKSRFITTSLFNQILSVYKKKADVIMKKIDKSYYEDSPTLSIEINLTIKSQKLCTYILIRLHKKTIYLMNQKITIKTKRYSFKLDVLLFRIVKANNNLETRVELILLYIFFIMKFFLVCCQKP